jgi:hypothetical protein
MIEAVNLTVSRSDYLENRMAMLSECVEHAGVILAGKARFHPGILLFLFIFDQDDVRGFLCMHLQAISFWQLHEKHRCFHLAILYAKRDFSSK